VPQSESTSKPADDREVIWTCKIGGVTAVPLRDGADAHMRAAVQRAFAQLTAEDPKFTLSGWGGTLTPDEREAVEPKPAAAESTAPAVPNDADYLSGQGLGFGVFVPRRFRHRNLDVAV
jgi:hypothetical protein